MREVALALTFMELGMPAFMHIHCDRVVQPGSSHHENTLHTILYDRKSTAVVNPLC